MTGSFITFTMTGFRRSRALNAGLLPADYYALNEQTAGGLGPDVLTLEHAPGWPRSAEEPSVAGYAVGVGVALATTPPKVRFTVQRPLRA
jgi:hypothetical protein